MSWLVATLGNSVYVHLCSRSLLDSLFLFCFSLQDSGPGGCFLLIRMQSTCCSPGTSGFVAMEGTIFGGRQWARTTYVTIQQICSVPNGLFPLLPGGQCLPTQILSWVWKRSLPPSVSEEGQWGERSPGSPWELVWEKEELVRLYNLFH